MALNWGQVAYYIIVCVATTIHLEPDYKIFSQDRLMILFQWSFNCCVFASLPVYFNLPFINFGDFCQPVHLLHPPRLLFWSKFVSLPVYSVLLFYLKLKNNLKTVNFKILTIKSFQRLHHVQPDFDLLFLKLKVISATKLFFAVK